MKAKKPRQPPAPLTPAQQAEQAEGFCSVMPDMKPRMASVTVYPNGRVLSVKWADERLRDGL